jgi:hypothetical protein
MRKMIDWVSSWSVYFVVVDIEGERERGGESAGEQHFESF